jgi:hypothetical protein
VKPEIRGLSLSYRCYRPSRVNEESTLGFAISCSDVRRRSYNGGSFALSLPMNLDQINHVDRRQFMNSALLAASITEVASGATEGAAPRPVETRRGDMLYRSFGKTGETVSVLGVGGSHIGLTSSDELAIRIVRTAIDCGVNYMDNSWDYNNGNGQAETKMGKALRDGYRQKVFLMTKVDGRTKPAAAKQLDESLKRLQADHIDLLQFHEVIRMEDPDRFFADGGALEAFLEARKAGKIRYIGFTGHKDQSPSPHAGTGASTRIPFRCRPFSLERDGLEFSELRPPGDARGYQGRRRDPNHEVNGRQVRARGRRRLSDRVPSICPESTDFSRDPWHGEDGISGTLAGSGEELQAVECGTDIGAGSKSETSRHDRQVRVVQND